MTKIVNQESLCLQGGREGCEIAMSEIPSLAKMNLKLCKTHTEVISFNRSKIIPDEAI